MKTKLILILIFQFFALACFPQKLVRGNVVWSSVLFEGPPGTTYYTTHTKFEGDTVINSLPYKRIFRSSNEFASNWQPSNCEFIRENNNKVFFYNSSIGNEYLYYDFSLSEGDSFYIYWQDPIDDIPLIVDSIRTISIIGTGYKHWFLSSIEYNVIWAEKIGSFYGILLPIGDLIGAGLELLCVSENDELIYQNEKYNTCFMKSNNVSVFENTPKLIEVFSNSEGHVFIQSVKEHYGDFYMYTTDGKQILKCPLTAPETILCAPGAGLFLYRFVSEKGGVQSGKVVVK